MQVCAELRWFWKGDCPAEIAAWFNGPDWSLAPARVQRRDRYFVQPGNVEIGCKVRDVDRSTARGAQLKALITRFDRNRIELWGKWNWFVPASARSVLVCKERALRLCTASGSTPGSHGEVPLDKDGSACPSVGVPQDACQIELTKVQIAGDHRHWWTLGLEAWGDLPSAPLVLARSLDFLDPPVGNARLCNYPQFLNELPEADDDIVTR